MELQYQEITVKKQNRKERQLALRTALTEKVNDKELIAVENLTLETQKQKI